MTMFRMRKSAGLTPCPLVLVSTLLTLSLGTKAIAAEPGEQRSRLSAPIEGSWICQVTNSSNPASTFTALVSFTAGGVLLATGSTSHSNHPEPSSPLYGSWKQKEHNLYIATTHFFGFDPLTGEANAMLKVVQTFKLINHDELVGADEYSVCDVQGQHCQSIPAADDTLKGTRMVPQEGTQAPLP